MLTDRDNAILAHLGLYRLSVRSVLAKEFFAGKDTALGNVLKRLIRQGYVCSRPLPRQVSYYQLTKKGAAAAGVPASRCSRPGQRALQSHLGVLWFCHMGALPRQRLEESDLAEIFGEGVLRAQHVRNKPHCMEQIGERLRVCQVYAPDVFTDVEGIIRRVRRSYFSALKHKVINRWVKTGSFGFSVLIPGGESRRKEVADALSSPLDGGPSIRDQAALRIELVPSYEQMLGASYAAVTNR